MSSHHKILVNTVMQQFSTCRYNDKKNRFEATANGIKNMGYGQTEQEAKTMLRKIVDNNVRERPELENMEEHEAYEEKPRQPAGNVTNVFHNIQGVVNTGNLSKMENVTISVTQSIANLTNKDLAEQLKTFVNAVQESDLPEEAKVEVIDRADVITVEATKPPEKRLMHRITDNVKGIGEILKGAAAVKTVWDVVEPAVRGYFGF